MVIVLIRKFVENVAVRAVCHNHYKLLYERKINIYNTIRVEIHELSR